jgi:hypothetical protein
LAPSHSHGPLDKLACFRLKPRVPVTLSGGKPAGYPTTRSIETGLQQGYSAIKSRKASFVRQRHPSSSGPASRRRSIGEEAGFAQRPPTVTDAQSGQVREHHGACLGTDLPSLI